jgi:predicted O-methyltransferase YrrM
MAHGARLTTYDIAGWRTFEGTLLREDDFGEHLEQRLGDLSRDQVFRRERDLLAGADLVFIDGPKDGRFEPAFLERLLPVLRDSGALLVIDDIRFLSMIELWRSLPCPKLDVTSLAHYSGTGLVDLT